MDDRYPTNEGKRADRTGATADGRVREAVDAADLCTWDWNFASVRLEWSRRFAELNGREPETFGATVMLSACR